MKEKLLCGPTTEIIGVAVFDQYNIKRSYYNFEYRENIFD